MAAAVPIYSSATTCYQPVLFPFPLLHFLFSLPNCPLFPSPSPTDSQSCRVATSLGTYWRLGDSLFLPSPSSASFLPSFLASSLLPPSSSSSSSSSSSYYSCLHGTHEGCVDICVILCSIWWIGFIFKCCVVLSVFPLLLLCSSFERGWKVGIRTTKTDWNVNRLQRKMKRERERERERGRERGREMAIGYFNFPFLRPSNCQCCT